MAVEVETVRTALEDSRHERSIHRRKATGRCEFSVGRIANPSENHSVLGMFPSAGRLTDLLAQRPSTHAARKPAPSRIRRR